MEDNKLKIEVPIMANVFAKGEHPEYLFWVGCAGAFDKRYQKVAKSFAKILNHLNVSYATLGAEESCTGDPAKRAGNEMLFQMQAMTNIQILNGYEVKKIITICPHCFNIFKNEYPELGGNYEVIHHTQFLKKMMDEGKFIFNTELFSENKVTFHDPCYLGRGNEIYDEPRDVIKAVAKNTIEMERSRNNALCCGAGGAQMFKEAEKGDKEIFMERTEDVIKCGADIVATACPFCMTMLTDGLKYKEKEESMKNLDIAEMVCMSLGL